MDLFFLQTTVAISNLSYPRISAAALFCRWRLLNRVQQLLLRNRCRAPFHHHNAAGVICQMGRLFRSGPGRERGGVSRDHRVSGAGDISGLVTAEDGNIQRLVLAGKGHHALTPAGDDQRVQLHARDDGFAGGAKGLPVLPDLHAESFLDFGLVGSSGGDAGKIQHAVARVQHDRN